jgi:hypothetical protein
MLLAHVPIFVAGAFAVTIAGSGREARIRNLGVGLIALATFAAAGLLLRRRHVVAAGAGQRSGLVESLYAAGL